MDPTTGPAPRESIDDVVRGLRELRGSVGDPSFAQIAQRITERRIARGTPEAAARTAAHCRDDAARHFSQGIRSADWGLWEVTRNGRIRRRTRT